MIQQTVTLVTVAAAGTPVQPYVRAKFGAPQMCCGIFIQAVPGNTGNVLVKNQQGVTIAWLAPGGGNNAAGNPLPGGMYSWPPFAGASLGNPIDATQYQIDVEVSGEKANFVIGVAI